MLLSIPCTAGNIQLTDDGALQIAQFGKALWQVPTDAVTGFVIQPGSIGTVNVFIESSQGSYTAEMVTTANFEKLQAAFPQLQTWAAGSAWYESPTALSHVETYSDEKTMQREVEAAYQRSWMIQGRSGQAGHVNVGRTAGKRVLTGGRGLLTGVSRSKDKTTITFVRSSEWLEQHH